MSGFAVELPPDVHAEIDARVALMSFLHERLPCATAHEGTLLANRMAFAMARRYAREYMTFFAGVEAEAYAEDAERSVR